MNKKNVSEQAKLGQKKKCFRQSAIFILLVARNVENRMCKNKKQQG